MADAREHGGGSGRGPVTREQYELLLEEAQAVERERVRLEEELTRAAVERAKLETELGHARDESRRALEAARDEAEARRRLADEVADARAERAVAVARLETLGELQERVRSLEEANNQLAFALRDAGQGFRQTLLQSGAAPAQPASRARRVATGVAGVVGLAALAIAAFEVAGLSRAVVAGEARAAEERVRDRESRDLLAGELRRSREEASARTEALREEQAERWRAFEEASRARAEAREAEAAARAAEWRAERGRLAGDLERLGAELEAVRREAEEARAIGREAAEPEDAEASGGVPPDSQPARDAPEEPYGPAAPAER